MLKTLLGWKRKPHLWPKCSLSSSLQPLVSRELISRLWKGKLQSMIESKNDSAFSSAKWGFPGGLDGKESACNAGDPGLIPGLGRFPCRRKWQPTLVFLPGEFQEQRSWMGYSPLGWKQSDVTEWLSMRSSTHHKPGKPGNQQFQVSSQE